MLNGYTLHTVLVTRARRLSFRQQRRVLSFSPPCGFSLPTLLCALAAQPIDKARGKEGGQTTGLNLTSPSCATRAVAVTAFAVASGASLRRKWVSPVQHPRTMRRRPDGPDPRRKSPPRRTTLPRRRRLLQEERLTGAARGRRAAPATTRFGRRRKMRSREGRLPPPAAAARGGGREARRGPDIHVACRTLRCRGCRGRRRRSCRASAASAASAACRPRCTPAARTA
mmetsp:Transcript_28230/g.91961  ORF Transcript_28230/g.91961 Transcript_28230/m.91961 type:complete len:227 (-) Transcript_28230:259-939(-)